MRKILLFALMAPLMEVASACQCMGGFESLPDDAAGRMLAVQLAKREVLSADEVLRVRVLSRNRASSNASAYSVQTLEALKSRSTQVERKLESVASSCNLDLGPGEEWLLFVHDGRVAQCRGSSLLGGRTVDVPGLAASDVADMNASYYKTGARWLELVRAAAASQR